VSVVSVAGAMPCPNVGGGRCGVVEDMDVDVTCRGCVCDFGRWPLKS
jgi:hypothetical protein